MSSRLIDQRALAPVVTDTLSVMQIMMRERDSRVLTAQAHGRREADATGEFTRGGRAFCHDTRHDVSHLSQRQEIVWRRPGVQGLQKMSFRTNLPHADVDPTKKLTGSESTL